MARATPPAKRREVFLPDDDERVDGDAHYDGGNAVENICGEPDGGGERSAAAELREVNTSGDTDRNAHETGNQQNDARAYDRVRHASARFADGRRNVSEEGEVERACAFVDEIEEDSDQRQNNNDRRQDGQAANEIVGRSAAGVVHAHGLRLEVHRPGMIAGGLGGHVSAPALERRV